MMTPWTAAQHVDMHWRPDAIIKTSVIQPMWVRQVSPVDMARHTIDPFIASVRGAGPAVSPYPSPADVAYAAGKVAQQFARGKNAVVCMGTEKITVSPNMPPSGGIVGTITAAAQQLARGGTVSIQIGPQRLIVCMGPSGEPQVTAAPAAPAAAAVTTSTPPKQAGVRAEPAQSAPARTEVAVRQTPMTAEQQKAHPAHPAHPAQSQKPAGFGIPMTADTRLPKQVHAGGVPTFPFLDYANAYRMLNYNDNVWARRNFQARLAARYAPQPIAAQHAALTVPINFAHRQVAPALATRAPMVQQRWPHPYAVWPRNASVNVRKEQR